MEVRQLEAFAAVVTTGSVTAAGRLLGRSQPAITRLIQELEAELGFALFTRSGPRVSPTEQGFLLYDEVEQTLAGMQRIRTRAAALARGDGRPLRIAATPALAAGLLPPALALAFARGLCAPERVAVQSQSPEQVVHAVLTGAADIGLNSLPLEHRGVTVHWIGQSACVAALRADDPLAAQPALSLHDCRGRRLITMHNPYRLRRRVDRALAGAGVPAAGVIDTNTSISALTLVRAGLGIALLEPVTARGLPLTDIAVRPIDADIPFFFGVMTPQARPASTAVLGLVQAVADAAAGLLPDLVRREPAEHGALLQSLYGDAANAVDAVDAGDAADHPTDDSGLTSHD
ncbi:LysR family transcriptional regulator [Cupriavidus taiwanensis]|uniref:Putative TRANSCRIPTIONal REGULATOR, LysR family n=1 Tax=Cupriavidus taiwanensis TaxID=164546 RepID=A0A7Z7J9Z2_9BURK|nr:LysR family transcriptional regulator [Cupriavidus taiwanensis]SOY85409.1 putative TRANSCRIPTIONal REGULATOR, LysR family [Cupriavidus taiwanensis]SOZ03860.1 putative TRANSCRIPTIONal REGULATOR, LysR family [Cupriavidus taiwanensis]SOZ04575.1 putative TRANSCRIPTIONal REGULATOR, LysR family [Cupriavidus taiwanensis]SPC09946.1 putative TRANSCRIPTIONal REGULATOR, LysR family [Cupriavidus taiwanensis]SPD39695.1 putative TRANSCRIPTIONal REGULATOR, LysR family [Cupriavidus taiwanensis]